LFFLSFSLVKGQAWQDCCAHAWCGLCSELQMAKELKFQGYAPLTPEFIYRDKASK
jgi:hypothetical protein